MSVQIGIIGGSGLYDMAELTDREERRLSTPFGEPSGPYVVGTLRGKRVAFLARHGAGHRISPSELNFRANIFGFKQLGVEWILSASAVGSLQEQYRPMDIVFPDQFIDRNATQKVNRGCFGCVVDRGLHTFDFVQVVLDACRTRTAGHARYREFDRVRSLQGGHLCSPPKSGWRFSRNAAMPSWASGVVAAADIIPTAYL